MNEIVTYFAYGSNLLTDQMKYRCPGAHPMRLAELAGWQFGISERAVATVTPAEMGNVWGGLGGIGSLLISTWVRLRWVCAPQ
jgi:hypothetical protein